MDALFTIGYEKADSADFVATLAIMDITLLVDVRERAMSRRAGFAKTALRNNLAAEGIDYLHLKALGSPSDIRNQLRIDWDYDKFFADYSVHLREQTVAIESIMELEGRVVLLCYERNPHECHRLPVAQQVAERAGLEIQHLGVQAGIGRPNRKTTRLDTRQSVSAT